ncbi:MAG: hypothetical protein KC777_17955 [Cyanobacteria bacterium HKST-UBA02]|nr:hypothetical protein [Cyanobacteria bacterium HKST-UBA02]
MHELEKYIEELPGLTSFIDTAMERSLVQGVVLDVNPLWLRIYQIEQTGLSSEMLRSPYRYPLLALDNILIEPFDSTVDLTVDIEGKNALTEMLQFHFEKDFSDSSSKFIVKIVTRPLRRRDMEEQRRLLELVRSASFPAIMEARSPGKMAIDGGDACESGGKNGTIGGFLRDQHGTIYAATCGHVASVGSMITRKGKVIGTCTYSNAPDPMPEGETCNSHCTVTNKLDFALIELNTGMFRNRVSGIADEVGCRESVFFKGAASGSNAYMVGGILLRYCPGNSNVCFENLIEIRPRISSSINPIIGRALAKVPIIGDSGGWVETTSNEWCGVLVAVDDTFGYAQSAKAVIEEAQDEFDLELAVLP